MEEEDEEAMAAEEEACMDEDWLEELFSPPPPSALFQGGAVLQRGVAAPVWGVGATPHSTVALSLAGKAVGTATATAAGTWRASLPAQHTRWNVTLEASDGSSGARESVVVSFGEVLLCSGQSNSEFPRAFWEPTNCTSIR